MKQLLTQKEIAFYVLYQSHKLYPEEYVPTWKFVGEIYIHDLQEWVMASYKCPTRLTDIYQDNPRLFERKLVVGKSGAKYYEYRFSPEASIDLILDKSLRALYMKIRKSG